MPRNAKEDEDGMSVQFSSVSWCLYSLVFRLISGITEGTWVMNQPFHLPSVGTDIFFSNSRIWFQLCAFLSFSVPFSQTWCLTLYLSLWSVSSVSFLAVGHIYDIMLWWFGHLVTVFTLTITGSTGVWDEFVEAEIEGNNLSFFGRRIHNDICDLKQIKENYKSYILYHIFTVFWVLLSVMNISLYLAILFVLHV